MSSATESGEIATAFGPAVLAVLIGLGVIIFTFLLKWIKQEQSNEGTGKMRKKIRQGLSTASQAGHASRNKTFADDLTTRDDKPDKVKGSSTDASGKHGKKEQAGSVKSSKKKLTERENRRTARANEKGFNHPWLLATFKGHSGRVLDMDYSANGKYLVSCGDENPDPGGMLHHHHHHHSRTSSPSCDDTSSNCSMDSNKENDLPSRSTPSPVLNKGLSRRQRKNRKSQVSVTKQEKEQNELKPEQVESRKNSQERVKNLKKARDEKQVAGYEYVDVSVRSSVDSDVPILDEYRRMSMPEEMFVQILKEKYSLSKEVMASMGYPLRPELKVYQHVFQYVVRNEVYYCYGYYPATKKPHSLDVHAREFVPKNDSGDSGNGSSSSSEEDSGSGSEAGVEKLPKLALAYKGVKNLRIRVCVRCGTMFYTTAKKYLTTDKCSYHPGRIRTMKGNCGPMIYSCCDRDIYAPGCTLAEVHVWPGPTDAVIDSSYVETEPPKIKRADNNYGAYSLDCEMSYTVTGLEVVKVTLVDITGRPVYNEYVKPVNEIVDFNTRYSGIDEKDFIAHCTKSLVEVQQDLKQFICSETVLIGHGLENDLKGLRMIHKTVVDTAFTFPHFKGLPFKRSLRSVVHESFGKHIQVDDKGHDSFEDARACMELMLYRLRRDFPDNF